MKILVSGNDIIFFQEEFLSVFHFLKCSVDIATRDPEEKEDKKDSTTNHAKDKVKFFVVSVGVKVLSTDLIAIIEAISQNNRLISICSEGFSRPKYIFICTIIPPRKNRVINEVFLLGHL